MTSNLPPPYTTRQLRRYSRYPKLYAERKYPHPSHPSSYPTQPFRLMHLPPELRMLTYAAALTLPFPIDLWPETDDPIASHHTTTTSRNMQYVRAKMRQHGVNLNLLRVSRQVRFEATRCFYEENEWRFSGTNGWLVAAAFMFNVAKFGWQHIRCVTLPFPFRDLGHGRAQQRWGTVGPAVGKRAVVRLAKQIPFAVPEDWEYEGSVRNVCCALAKCGTVRVVRLVLPVWLDGQGVDGVEMEGGFAWVEKMKEIVGGGVEIQLVRLSGKSRMMGDVEMAHANQSALVERCSKRGWVVRTARCDKFGRFDVEDE
jgi:hypothetical protein